jgi:predicted flap endonuclease-1-like 5' DNA nuclease
MAKIDEVEGIGAAFAEKLVAAGVKTTDDLLSTGATSAGRDKLADATGISGKLILEWVNHCDLMRLKGVGSEYSDLLEAAGVDSPAELAQRNAANLANTIAEVVAARPGIVRRAPTEAIIQGWIDEAKSLDKIVSH